MVGFVDLKISVCAPKDGAQKIVPLRYVIQFHLLKEREEFVSRLINMIVYQDGRAPIACKHCVSKHVRTVVSALRQIHALVLPDGLIRIAQHRHANKRVEMVVIAHHQIHALARQTGKVMTAVHRSANKHVKTAVFV